MVLYGETPNDGGSVRRRSELTEWMDEPGVNRADLAGSLAFIRRVNRYLGGTRAVMGHLRQWSARWSPLDTITILDVATGSADIPLAILQWARQRKLQARIFALDLHPTTLELAQEHVRNSWAFPEPPPLEFVRGDALALPFADRSIDYVISSMFFHHLSDESARAALREMLRVARRGIIVNDLLRTRFARLGIHVLTLLAGPIDKHDGRVSVQKAWTREEVEGWKTATGSDWLVYHHHVPARFTLAGERRD